MRKRVAAVVLAAGRATRFSGGKLLVPAPERPLIRITVEKLVDLVDDVVVVLGNDSDRVLAALGDLNVRVQVNENYEDGIGSSVAAGVRALAADVDAALIALGDQPIPPSVIEQLIAAYRSRNKAIVAPVYDGTLGNPVLFDRSFFSELLQLNGDRGARALIEQNPARMLGVAFPFAPPIDVDTAEDYGLLLRQSLEPPPAN